MIVSYHVGGSIQSGTIRARSRNLPGERRMAFDMGLGNGATSFFEPFVNLFTLGTLERHPKLRFVLGESGTARSPLSCRRWTTGSSGPVRRGPSP